MNNENNKLHADINYDSYLNLGKLMCSDMKNYTFNNVNINDNTNNDKYEYYKNNYINKLDKQIEQLEDSLNKISNEVNELERKNVE